MDTEGLLSFTELWVMLEVSAEGCGSQGSLPGDDGV